MFRKKSIIHFPDFKFPDGRSKSKFLIVLDEVNGQVLLCNLPSSQRYSGDTIQKEGCLHIDYGDNGTLHFYCFLARAEIGIKKFSFIKDTFCYFTRSLFEISSDKLKAQNPEFKDQLTEHYYHELIYCAYKGREIPIKYKPKFEEILQEYYGPLDT